MGWARVAGEGLEIYQIPGDHFTFIHEHARPLAEQLAACLRKARGQSFLRDQVLP
jgi:surfactin synthase thioesterase subunit